MVQVETSRYSNKIELPIKKINTENKFDYKNFYSKGKWIKAIVCRMKNSMTSNLQGQQF